MSVDVPMTLDFDEDSPAEGNTPVPPLEVAAEEPARDVPADAAPTAEKPAEQPAPTEEPAPAETPSSPETAESAEEDDLDRAIAELGPAPEHPVLPAASVVDPVIAIENDDVDSAPLWPFATYVAAWLAFAAFIVWRFYGVSADTALYEVPLYRWVVIGGVALTVIGPLLALGVWALTLRRPGVHAGALFASALFKGAIATFAGVAIWWASLLILDQIRIGSLL